MASEESNHEKASDTEHVRRRGDRRVTDLEVAHDRRKADRRETPGLSALMRTLLRGDSSSEG